MQARAHGEHALVHKAHVKGGEFKEGGDSGSEDAGRKWGGVKAPRQRKRSPHDWSNIYFVLPSLKIELAIAALVVALLIHNVTHGLGMLAYRS